MSGRVAGMKQLDRSVPPPRTKPVGRNQAADMSMYQQTRSPFIQQSEALAMDKTPRWTDVGQGRQAMSSAYDQDMFQNISGLENISRNQEDRQEGQYNRIQDANFNRDSRASAQQFQQNRALQGDQLEAQKSIANAQSTDNRYNFNRQLEQGYYGMNQQRDLSMNAQAAQEREGEATRNAQAGLQAQSLATDTANRESDRSLQRSLATQADATARRGQDLQFAAAQYGNDSAKYQAFLGASQGQRYWGNW